MDSSSTEPAFARVARLTAELFFEIGEVKVMEALIQAPRVRGPDGGDSPVLQLDEDVAERLRLGTKQVRQYLGRLHSDRLVVKLRADVAKEKNAYEPPPLANEAPLLTAGSVRCYYGLDYITLVDAVMYKLDAMERALEAERRSAGEMQLYRCPRCSTTIDSLSINPLMMMEGTLKCEVRIVFFLLPSTPALPRRKADCAQATTGFGGGSPGLLLSPPDVRHRARRG